MAQDDEALLTAWRGGDAAAGEALFARYFDRLYGFFANKVAPDDVGDLVQKVFVASVESADRFRGEASVRAYVYGIARNVLHRHYRTQRRAPNLDFGVSSLFDLAPSPSSLMHRAEQSARLREALAQLPLDLQLLVELRFDEGLSGPELAQALAIPEGTVRSRLRRALQRLEEALRDAPAPDRAMLSTWTSAAE